jgi:hypothetical protein
MWIKSAEQTNASAFSLLLSKEGGREGEREEKGKN